MVAEDKNSPADDESVQELYENAPCGYLTVAPDGLIRKANQTLLRWLGYERSELVEHKRFVDLLSSAGRIFHETHYRPLLHMQGSVDQIALDLVSKDGQRLPVLVNARLCTDDAGNPLDTRVTVFNVAQRRKYERELLLERRRAEQEAKAKADFLASASHEIRNYLHSIAAVAELLARRAEGKHDRFIKLLESSSQNLMSLVNDVLDYSKLEAGKLSLDEREFSLRELFESLQASLRARAELKGLTLSLRIDERLPARLCGDPSKIAQVLVNLGSNAVKFTESGAVTITAQLEELGPDIARVRFSVSDTGVGIPPEHLDKIFEEYTRGSREVAAHHEGTGLGLAICQRILKLYGSVMEVESALGVGSVFSFELQLRSAEAAAGRGAVTAVLPDNEVLRGLKVLVAEDAEGDALAITRLLERYGADYEIVGTGRDALERVQHSEYDVVLMDVQLPVLDGFDATVAIRKLLGEGREPPPIIALSGSVEVNQRARLAGAGFTDFLGKPFESEALLRSISTHGEPHRALRLGRGEGRLSL